MSTVQQLGGVKLGSSDAEGIFVGSTQVAGKEFAFDWSKLYENLSFIAPDYTGQNFLLIVANLSSYDVDLYRRNNSEAYHTTVEAGRIDWYEIGCYENDSNQNMFDYYIEGFEGNPALRYVRFFCQRYDRDSDNYFAVTRGTISDTDYIERDNTALSYEHLQYADVIFIFDN